MKRQRDDDEESEEEEDDLLSAARDTENGYFRVQECLAAGADVNTQDKFGSTALHQACWYGEYEKTEMLIVEYGANVDIQDTDGRTPSLMVCQNGDWVDDNNLRIFRLLMEHGNVDFIRGRDKAGWTHLHLACENGDEKLGTIKFLLDHDAIVNTRCNDGFSPLHIACRNFQSEAAEFLMENGAKANVKGNNGRTPLYDACGGSRVSQADQVAH